MWEAKVIEAVVVKSPVEAETNWKHISHPRGLDWGDLINGMNDSKLHISVVKS